LALIAPEFVFLVLGKKWQGVIAPLQVLAFYGSFRSITTLLPQVLTVIGESDFVMWNTLTALILLPLSFYTGSSWGTVGIAWAWIVAYPLIAVPLYQRAFRKICMPIPEYLGAVQPALNGSVAMAAAVCALKWLLPATWALHVRFGLEVLAGAVAYSLIMVVFYQERLLAFWGLARTMRGSD
jgi:O-antigen/teichoic acid export membrane protein